MESEPWEENIYREKIFSGFQEQVLDPKTQNIFSWLCKNPYTHIASLLRIDFDSKIFD